MTAQWPDSGNDVLPYIHSTNPFYGWPCAEESLMN